MDFLARPWLTNSSCSLVKLAGGLIPGLYQTQDFKTIAKDEDLIVTLPNGLANLLYIKLLEL